MFKQCKLQFIFNTTANGYKTRQSNLVFNKESSSEKHSDISQIKKYLSEMCGYMNDTYHDYTMMSRSFSRVVNHLRQLDVAAVTQAYESLEGVCPTNNDDIKFEFIC